MTDIVERLRSWIAYAVAYRDMTGCDADLRDAFYEIRRLRRAVLWLDKRAPERTAAMEKRFDFNIADWGKP